MDQFVFKRPRSAPPFPEEARASTAALRTAGANRAFAQAEKELRTLAARLDAPAPSPVAGVAVPSTSTSAVGDAIEAAGRAGASRVTVDQSPEGEVRAVAEFPKKRDGRKLFKDRYDDVVAKAALIGLRLVATREEWSHLCTDRNYKPQLVHATCGTQFESTSVDSLMHGRMGCPNCTLQPFRDRYDDVVAKAKELKCTLVATREQWPHLCTNHKYKPELIHDGGGRPGETGCGTTFRSSTIAVIMVGALGCPTCKQTPWRERYDNACGRIEAGGGVMVESRADFERECTGALYKPLVRCTKKETCTTPFRGANLVNLQSGQGVGCPNCTNNKHLWGGRMDEGRRLVKARRGVLLTTEAEWVSGCAEHGYVFKPRIQCLDCKDIVTSTAIGDLQQGRGFGCVGCKNKTEGKLLRWLQARYPDVQAQQPQFKRAETTNGRLKFDFSLPSERWIIELDGNISGGHFDDMPGNDCPVRDLEKEEWALEHGWQVIRVLQEDVWRNRSGWDNYLLTELAHWATRRDAGQAPRKAITPQAPEYLGGVYKRLRSTVDTGPQLDTGGCSFCGAALGGFDDVCMKCGTLR